MLQLHTRRSGTSVVLEAVGHIQAGNSETRLRRETDALIAGGVRLLVLDLSSVDGLDAAGVGALLDVRNLFERTGGNLILLGPSERIRRVLNMCGLDEVFDVEETNFSAVGAARSSFKLPVCLPKTSSSLCTLGTIEDLASAC